MTQILGNPQIEEQVSSFTLVPSDGGRFELTVNGDLLFSKKKLGRHAEPGELLNLIREKLAEDA